MKWNRFRRGLFPALLAAGSAASAAPDQVQIDMVGQYPLALRWDNVTTAPIWVSGAKPFHVAGGRGQQEPERHQTAMHRVRLSPGESVTVWVSANEGLRIYRANGRLTQAELDVATSNGSGLYLSMPVQPSAAGDSLLLPPDWPEERLARITRPANASEALEVALFVSRREALGQLAPHRDLIRPDPEIKPEPEQESARNPPSLAAVEPTTAPPDPPDQETVTVTGTRVLLRQADEATAEPFWRLDTRPTIQLRLRGPRRVALEHRLRYPTEETQAQQAYRVYAWLNGRPWQALDFVGAQETRQAIMVNGCAETLGRLETGYLELPAGDHELSLGATQPLYLRPRAQDDPDYLFPNLNAPRLTAAQARAMRPVAHGSIWDLTPAELARPLGQLSLAEQERTALRLGRDNSYREGGLAAALTMRQVAMLHREEPRLGPQAQQLVSLFTFYRSLFPVAKATPAPPRLAWLRNRRLLGWDERPRELVIAKRFSDDLLDTLAAAYFLELAPNTELQYRLPERQKPSVLRIAVEAITPTPAEFWLRYDAQPPRRLRVQPPELASDVFLAGVGEAALLLLGERHGVPAANTLAAPFAAQRTPGPLIPAAVVEVALPANVRQISLSGASQPLAVALQYRASRSYQLSESEYLEVAQQLGSDVVFQLLQNQIHQAGTSAPREQADAPAAAFATARDAQRELINHWLPLSRWLRAQVRQLTATLGPPPATQSKQGDAAGSPTEAKRLEQNQQWLPALEQWSGLIDSPIAETRAAAILGEARTLRQLNEEFLAEQMLRGAFLYDPSPLVAERVFAQLTQDYIASDDQDSLLALAGVAAARQPTPTLLRPLAELLLDQGYPDYALAIALGLPPAERPLPVVARAAYQLGWWRIFEKNLTQWPDPTQRRLWEGYRAQQQGAYQAALQFWREAGAPGQRLAEMLKTGLAIRDRLADSEAAVRARAIAEWTQWQSQQSGAHVWRDASHLFSDYAGTAALTVSERDLFSQTFRARSDQPAKISVYGPARLRIAGRLLHPAAATDAPPADDWLLLRDGERMERLPISGDRPSQELRLVGDATAVPGRLATLDYAVGPGLHTLEITARQRPLLVQAKIWRPEIPLSVLPELTPTAVVAAALGLTRGEPERRRSRRWDHWSPFGRHDIHAEQSPRQTTPAPNAALPVAIINGCQLERRPLLAFPMALPELTAQTALLARLTANSPPDLGWPSPPPTAEQALRQRLITLLWEVEQAPETLAQRLPEAEQMAAAQPGAPGVEALLRGLRRRAEWEPLLAVARSAGVRYVEAPGWQPESPFLRVRKTLTPTVAADEQVLAGTEQLGLLTTNATPTRLRIELQAADLRYSLPQPLIAWHRLDDRPAQSVTLAPDNPAHSVLLDIPPGQHVLRVGITAPVANQYLRVRVNELQGRTARPVIGDLRRLYQVATSREPLQVPLMGPAWVRIDELRDGRLDSSYQYLGPGLQTLQLQPAKGRPEGLYRLHAQRVGDTPRELTPSRVSRVTPERVPETPMRVLETTSPSAWLMQDRYALGEQQDGTWSLGTTLARSTPLPDESGGGTVVDEYLETLASYRYHDEWRRNYYQADALARWHRLGSPTFGLRAYWQHQTEWPGVSFQLNWEGYAQQSEDWAWNSTLRGRIWQTRDIDLKTRHQPGLGFFYRDLQQGADYDYRPGHVDQDVLSEYKYLHKRGLVLSDTLSHRPWLDTLWYAGVALTSDEDWNLLDPEHASVTVGWKQLLGDWQVAAAYQWSYYFAQDGRDWNRSTAYDQHNLRGGVLWEHAWGGAGRVQAELALQYSVDDREFGTWLSVNWFPDRGRGYRDFRPGTVEFRDLRERRLPLEFNNGMEPPPGEMWIP